MTSEAAPAKGRRDVWLSLAVLAVVAYAPLLLTHRGMIGADTKAYLTLDPARLLSRVWTLWDPSTGMGTVTHQNIGYLFPMGPWYWVLHTAGVPMWVAQRLWTGSLLFAAGAGVVVLLRTLSWRGPGPVMAAAFYMLNPYVVQYVARISAILMPWAALPWLLALTIRALRRGGWRDPALFAVVTTLVGGVNATSLILVGIAPVLWIAFAVWGLREVRIGPAVATALRIGVLTAVTAVWWVAGLALEGGYGLNVLRYTETVQTVATSGTAVEALRGLGNWYFYGLDAVGAWIQPAVDFTQWGWLLGVSLAVPVVAFASAMATRWRERIYFVALVVIGVALAVGVHPYSHPSPLGALLKAFANGSTAGLALRSTGRAVPLIALGTAVMIGAAVQAAWAHRPRVAAVFAVGLAALAVADMTPLFIGQFVDDQLQRPEAVPAYWTAAAGYLDSQGNATRVLEEPGADFLHYRWGATLDPVTPGLTNRPYVDRELVPAGSAASADLMRALDERLQEGILEPGAIAPLVRRMAVGDVVLRSDLQWERFRTPRPQETWALLNPAPAGLHQVRTFGPPVGDFPTVIPFVDEQALALPPSAAEPPAVAVYGVANPEALVRTEPGSTPIVVAGDGEGVVDASAAGLLGNDNPVVYAASPAGLVQALAPGADLVLTDTNRDRAQRFGTIRSTFGYTEEAGEQPLATDPNDARLPLFPGESPAAQTVAEEGGHGIAVVRASGYGNSVSYDPGSRPDLAIDGNPGTAWTVGGFGDPVGQYLRIDLSHPVTTGTITLQQPFTPHVAPPPGEPATPGPATVPGQRWITKVRLHFDRGSDVVVALDGRSRSSLGQAIAFPSRTFSWVQITIEHTNIPRTATTGTNGVGFSEVRIGGGAVPTVDEVLRLPTDLLSRVGASSIDHALTILMTRDQTNPAEPFTGQPEPSLARTFDLPTARTFSLGGVAQISALAPDYKLDPLLGIPNAKGMLIADSSSRLPGDLAARSSSTLDGDPGTFWSPARGPQVGNWIRIDVPHPVPLDHVGLQVIADGRHSVPTRIGVQVDGGPVHTLELPPIADRTTPNAVTTVPLSVPGTTVTDHVVFTVEAVRKETTLDNLSHTQVALPVAIAELGIPGLRFPKPAASVPATCRTDLLTVDGNPVGVRLVGTTAAAAARQDLTLQPCGPPLALGPGAHVVRTAPGSQTAIDVNRVVLASSAGGGPDPSLGVGPAAGSTVGGGHAAGGGGGAAAGGGARAAPVTVLGQGRTWARVRVPPGTGAPEWLVLAQSFNKGWTARIVGGGSLGPPTVVDGFANGWRISPGAGRPVIVDLSWAPQRGVDVALVVSVLGLLACVALIVLPSRSRPAGAPSPPPVLGAPWASRAGLGARRSVIVVIGTGLVGAVLINPAAGVLVGVLTAVSCGWRRGRVVLAGGAVALVLAAGVSELAVQLHHHFPLVLEWPQHFEAAGRLAWVAVALLGADAVVDRLRPFSDSHVRDAPGTAPKPDTFGG
ncbi:MAG TPA: alpha-(1-_3)-arabinofuranosyltransferase family protein [Acidimicrobiales bacterium]